MRDNFIVPYPNKLFVELSTTMLYDGRYLFAGYYSGAFCTCKGEGGGGGEGNTKGEGGGEGKGEGLL